MTQEHAFPTEMSLKREIAQYCERYCIVPNFSTSDPWDIETGHRDNWQFPDTAPAGCYAIYAGDGELLYIGKAWTRPEHWTKPPKYIQAIKVHESFEASSLEEYLIQKLRPRDNARMIEPARGLE